MLKRCLRSTEFLSFFSHVEDVFPIFHLRNEKMSSEIWMSQTSRMGSAQSVRNAETNSIENLPPSLSYMITKRGSIVQYVQYMTEQKNKQPIESQKKFYFKVLLNHHIMIGSTMDDLMFKLVS